MPHTSPAPAPIVRAMIAVPNAGDPRHVKIPTSGNAAAHAPRIPSPIRSKERSTLNRQ